MIDLLNIANVPWRQKQEYPLLYRKPGSAALHQHEVDRWHCSALFGTHVTRPNQPRDIFCGVGGENLHDWLGDMARIEFISSKDSA